MTWADIGLLCLSLVVFSFIAGAVDAWWEQRQITKGRPK